MPDPRDDAMIAQLRELGEWLDVPAAADQRAAVRARLQQRPHPGYRARRRMMRWLAAVAAAAVCTVVVVPPARAAVVDAVGGLLRIAGVEIRREPAAGPLPVRPAPLPSSSSSALDAARSRSRFTIRTPAGLGTPEVTLADLDPDGAPRVVTLTYRGGAVRLDQFDGRLQAGFLKSAPDAQWTEVGGQAAAWLPAPHPVTYVDRSGVERTEGARLAGPTLVWADGSVTYRLEGLRSLEQARTVAESLR